MYGSAQGHFIVGDWGTSRLRLFLCRHRELLERFEGPGVAVAGDVPGILLDLIRPWTSRHGPLPVTLSGMVGSGLGWKEVSHLECPMGANGLGRALHRFTESGHQIAIVPGLRCLNPLQAPDLMRGEETQILGALSTDESLATGRHLVCLPGTHTKWVELDDGTISHFLTGFSGELYALLRRYSVLVGEPETGDGTLVEDAFGAGVSRGRDAGNADLLHLLFEVRARATTEETSNIASVSFLSGLIVERDVAGALRAFRRSGESSSGVPALDGAVRVVGSPDLTRLYALALEAHGVPSRLYDGEAAAFDGLTLLHHSWHTEIDPHIGGPDGGSAIA